MDTEEAEKISIDEQIEVTPPPTEVTEIESKTIEIVEEEPMTFVLNHSGGSTTGDLTPKFEWSINGGGTVSKFQIYLGNSSENLTLFTETSLNYYDTPKSKQLYAGEKEWDVTKYFWQVKALDSEGNVIGESNVENFQLIKSLVGKDTVATGVYLNASAGENPIFTIREFSSPSSYGGNYEGVLNVPNACIFGGYGFADLGIVNGVESTVQHTRQHEYRMDFDAEIDTKDFALQMADWGDYLPYGKNEDGVYAITLFAYDKNDQVVDQDTISFTAPDKKVNGTETLEFGNLSISGDICTAAEGQPGNYTFRVSSQSEISYVVLKFKDRQSMDPNIGFRFPVINGVDTSPGAEPIISEAPEPTPTPSPTLSPTPSVTVTPTPQVLGAQTSSESYAGAAVSTLGRVLGASTELSATGLPVGGLLIGMMVLVVGGLSAIKRFI
jgi:hypothetical protein